MEYPHDKYGNPVPGREPPKDPACAGCIGGLPLKWTEDGWKHLDLFTTADYGSLYPCPVRYAPTEKPQG